MSTKVKFCGLTNLIDAEAAVAAGASFVGVVFAGGPRLVTVGAARTLLATMGNAALRVGVFGTDGVSHVAETARAAGLDVVQLHGDPRPSDVVAMRAQFSGKIWAAARVDGSLLPEWTEGLFREADAVLLDAHVAGRLGGSGRTLDWSGIRRSLDDLRGDTPLVLAGGLTPANVAQAIAIIAPDIVDVSSGIEREPGMKDHELMRAFVRAVREVE